MSREYASLLAQVVPVIAIALGIEIRAIIARIRDIGRENVPTWRLSTLVYLGFTLLVLGIVEICALAVVAGDFFTQSWTWFLALAILVAFIAPIFDAASEGLVGRRDFERIRKSLSPRHIVTLMILGFVALVNLILVIGSIFF
ncbi:hypothetical protein [Kribbella sp. NPDC051620]|uniref:hypothetical protein n=1 Tax=Kribbella sp. NPDC051620 TaxID=3364120 RepID=UPI003794A70E